MHPLLNIATQAARQASRHILRGFDQPDKIEVTEKTANNFVTNIDIEAERTIIEQIQLAYPSHSILSKEHGSIDGDEHCWIINPIDGTTNFIRGIPHFAVSIAVKKNDNLMVSLIYDPIRNELFTASQGAGSHLNNRRLRVSGTAKLKQSLIGTGCNYNSSEAGQLDPYLGTFKDMIKLTSGIRRSGSLALDLAYVASGRLDGYWQDSLHERDIAAGSLMVLESGGMLCDFNNEKDYCTNGSVIAANSKLFKSLSTNIIDSLHEL